MRNVPGLVAPPRIVGIDVGRRRVGLALADPLGLFARPHGVYAPEAARAELARLHAAEGLKLLVVGWPLGAEGEEGEATRMVNAFLKKLPPALRALDVARWDEGYTTEEARSRVGGRGKHGARPLVDAEAAGIILQEYLDRGRPGGGR